jgi:hypothetical protein
VTSGLKDILDGGFCASVEGIIPKDINAVQIPNVLMAPPQRATPTMVSGGRYLNAPAVPIETYVSDELRSLAPITYARK